MNDIDGIHHCTENACKLLVCPIQNHAEEIKDDCRSFRAKTRSFFFVIIKNEKK